MEREVSSNKYVYRRKKKFLAQVGIKYLGLHATEKAAKGAVIKYLQSRKPRASLQSTKLKKPRSTFQMAKLKKARSKVSKLANWVQRFDVLVNDIFKGWVPADYVGIIKLRKSKPEFTMCSSVLYSIAIRGKEWPFRKAVSECWQALSAKDKTDLWLLESHVPTESARAARVVHKVCAAAVRSMTKEDRTFWNASTNRHVGHHSGWVPLMRRLGIIKAMQNKTKSKDKKKNAPSRVPSKFSRSSPEVLPRSSKVLRFSGCTKRYQIVAFNRAKHTPRFRTLASVMHLLRSQAAPRSLIEWVKTMGSVRQMLKQMRGARDVANADSYTFLWFARAHFLGEVSMWRGQRGLEPSKKLKLSEFSQGFPDQCKWISSLALHFKAKTLGTLVSKLKYKRPAVFLCMDTCVFGDAGLRHYSLDELKRLRPQFKRKRVELQKANGGLEPHPVITMKEVRKEQLEKERQERLKKKQLKQAEKKRLQRLQRK